jgi:D-alanine transaminase
MTIAYFNGKFKRKRKISISPDDRGFLFADGVYEVIRWYKGFFFDMEGHMARLRRSLREVRIEWPEADTFPEIAGKLIKLNHLKKQNVIIYLQVTRGAAKRAHAFPQPQVHPTVYAAVRSFDPEKELISKGIGAILMKDTRWTRCDIKSVSLLPNILSFQEAVETGCYECIFSREGVITECSHSNIFMVIDGVLHTHPESDNILSGITRKNVIRFIHDAGIPFKETPISENSIYEISEAFVTNTSFEIAPVISINNKIISDGVPGPVTKVLRAKFDAEITSLKG